MSAGENFSPLAVAKTTFEIEPLHSGRSDLEARLDAFEILRRAALESLFHRDLPFALKPAIVAREKTEHAIVAHEAQASLVVGAGETRALEASERGAFGGEIACDVTPD